MNYSRPSGKIDSIGAKIKRELLAGPNRTAGRDTTIIGFVLAAIWLSLSYFQPDYPWLNGKFLAAAICFWLWGVADMLPRGWVGMVVFLRAAVWVFMLGVGIWIVAGLVS